ncbi:hypothetical protein BDV12DRAFT_150613 [Aspergillus spectabilis]
MSTPTPSHPDPPSQPQPQQPKTIPPPQSLPITTHHCRFCTTLLLATTRTYATLPGRSHPARDSARILPLRNYPLPKSTPSEPVFFPEEAETSDKPATNNGNKGDAKEEGKRAQVQKHYTILLSTATRDPKPKIIARSDGFEKRFFLRCGRCRVTVGYFLDEVHFPSEGGLLKNQAEVEAGLRSVGEEGKEDRAVYLLPGALMETEIMDDEEKMMLVDREWGLWFKG